MAFAWSPNCEAPRRMSRLRAALQQSGQIFSLSMSIEQQFVATAPSGAPAGSSASDERRKRAAADFDALNMPDPRTLDFIWDTVWWRRVSYFVTLISTAVVLLFPWLIDIQIGYLLIARGAGLMADLLPSAAHPWLKAFQSHTISFSLLLAVMFLFFLWGALLDRRIHDRALAAWTGTGGSYRLKSFQESLHGRDRTAALLVVPRVAAKGLLVVAVLLTRDMFLGVLAGLLGGLILSLNCPSRSGGSCCGGSGRKAKWRRSRFAACVFDREPDAHVEGDGLLVSLLRAAYPAVALCIHPDCPRHLWRKAEYHSTSCNRLNGFARAGTALC